MASGASAAKASIAKGTGDPIIKLNFDPSERDRTAAVVQELRNYADKLDLGDDIAGALAAIEEQSLFLRRKMLEMALLEFLAFNSTEPSILQARKKLFMVTKLVHNDYIQQALEDPMFQNAIKSDNDFSVEKAVDDGPFEPKRYKETKHWTLRGIRDRMNLARNARILWNNFKQKQTAKDGPQASPQGYYDQAQDRSR
jgi:hypothetical protein